MKKLSVFLILFMSVLILKAGGEASSKAQKVIYQAGTNVSRQLSRGGTHDKS